MRIAAATKIAVVMKTAAATKVAAVRNLAPAMTLAAAKPLAAMLLQQSNLRKLKMLILKLKNYV